MPDALTLALFLVTALGLAVMPGPGMLYVAARTLAGGRREGLASSLGTGLGGLVHVVAGALGVSVVVTASAEAFTLLKLAGAAYLVFLGIRTWRTAAAAADAVDGLAEARRPGAGRAFREGALVETLNPKTAAFFLALLPQFVDPAGAVAAQFVGLGLVCVLFNTLADVAVTFMAASARRRLAGRAGMLVGLRRGSAALLCGLGVGLALARRTA